MDYIYKPYEYTGDSFNIYNYLYLKEIEQDKDTYNIFDLSINKNIEAEIDNIKNNGYDNYELYFKKDDVFLDKFEKTHDYNNKKSYLYTEIICASIEKVILSIYALPNIKIWLNGEIICIHSDYKSDYVVVDLKKGCNYILAEIYSSNWCYLGIQVLNYSFETSNSLKSLYQCGSLFNIEGINRINNGDADCRREDKFKFMLMANDMNLYENKIKISISDNIFGEYTGFNPSFEDIIYVNFNQIIEIDINKYRKLCKYDHIAVWYTVITHSGKEYNELAEVLIKDFTDNKIKTIKKCQNLIEEYKEDTFAKNQLIGYLNNYKMINESEQPWSGYFEYFKLYKIINKIENKIDLKNEIYLPGVHEFYYESQLDNKIECILLRIPDNYTKDKVYPIILELATLNHGWCSHFIQSQKITEPYIFVDVTQRGISAGSIISEASVLDVLNYIKSIYKIDENRIYLSGCSNGGYCVWSLIENYPDLAAGAYPLTGLPYLPNIRNTYNQNIVNLISDNDEIFLGKRERYDNEIKHNRKYFQVDFHDYTHGDMGIYAINHGVFDMLLKEKKDEYPNKIYFRTERNRYLKSFWIKLYGIAFDKQYAQVKAIIENENRIVIDIINSIGITVQLPPQINKRSFDIIINNKIFHFNNTYKKELYFVNRNDYELVETEPLQTLSRKGTGILDVYHGKMKIIIPNNADDIIIDIAKKFSSPSSNGNDSHIYTQYPIYKEKNINEELINSNIVLIDLEANNDDIISNVKKRLKIKCDKECFEYNDIKYYGEYCLLQVIANPYNTQYSILAIETNNENNYKKNILTRRVLISSYCNGFNPYWNNEATLLLNNKYYGIYEWGQKLYEIK